MKLLAAALAAALALAPEASAAERPSFEGQPHGPYPAGFTGYLGLSADGTIPVGRSVVDGQLGAAVWIDGAPVLVPPAPGLAPTWAHDVSDDGAVVVGNGYAGAGGSGDEAFVSVNGATQVLGVPGGETGAAVAVSSDGSVVVLHAYVAGQSRAFRWVGGVAEELPLPAGMTGAFPRDVSADGSLIVGSTGSPSTGGHPILWSGSGSLILETPPIPGSTGAVAISKDGTVVAGQRDIEGASAAVAWLSGAPVELGSLGPGLPYNLPRDVANDGTVVGTSAGGGTYEAFIWRPEHGMKRLVDVLRDEYGVVVAGWKLTDAQAVSADGRTIVGDGLTPDGSGAIWTARLVTPECRNGFDDDGDGLVDYGVDSGCETPVDHSETHDCSNGTDDDGDGRSDFPADPGCSRSSDGTEHATGLPCDDGLDDDGDGYADFPGDVGCASLTWPSEAPACSNGADDDGDGAVDVGPDLACTAPHGTSEALRPVTETDAISPGDHLAARDPTLGLDWLKLPVTAGLSRDEVLAGAGGWSAAGWRHASYDEVCSLAGRVISKDYNFPCTSLENSYFFEFLPGFVELGQHLGLTQPVPWAPSSAGIYSDPYGFPDVAPVASWFLYAEPPSASFFTYYDLVPSSAASPQIGHFLVRPPPPACRNGDDDDGDGTVDWPADPACISAADPSESPDCGNGLDDDGDGYADLTDPGCASSGWSLESPACDDRMDNDGDGAVDLDDPHCTASWRRSESPARACGLGAELGLLAPLLSLLRRRRGATGSIRRRVATSAASVAAQPAAASATSPSSTPITGR